MAGAQYGEISTTQHNNVTRQMLAASWGKPEAYGVPARNYAWRCAAVI